MFSRPDYRTHIPGQTVSMKFARVDAMQYPDLLKRFIPLRYPQRSAIFLRNGAPPTPCFVLAGLCEGRRESMCIGEGRLYTGGRGMEDLIWFYNAMGAAPTTPISSNVLR